MKIDETLKGLVEEAVKANPDADNEAVTGLVLKAVEEKLGDLSDAEKPDLEKMKKEMTETITKSVTEEIARAAAEKEMATRVEKAAAIAVQDFIEKNADLAASRRGMAFPSGGPAIVTSKNRAYEFSFMNVVKALKTQDWSHAKVEREYYKKAVGSTPASAGGFLVPTEQSSGIIGALDEKTVARLLGATIMPMSSDHLEIMKEGTAAEGTWVGASQSVTTTDPTWELLHLYAKKLMAYIPISNEWLKDTTPDKERFIRKRLVDRFARSEDKAVLKGAGVGPEPLGIINVSGINTDPTRAIADLTYDHVLALSDDVELNNSEITGFATHPTVKNTLRRLQDGAGRYMWGVDVAERVPQSLDGKPVAISTNLTDSNGTDFRMIGGDWEEVVIGQRDQIEIAVSEHVNFANDQTVIRATMRMDVLLLHPETFNTFIITA